MSGETVGEPPALFARWCQVSTRGAASDEAIATAWNAAYTEDREFWRELDAATRNAQPDVTVDQLAAALDGKGILVAVGTGTELRKPVRPHDLAVQLLDAIDAQRTVSGLERAKRAQRGPEAVTMEILERDHKTSDSLAGSIIVPSEVRINGIPVLTSADEPIRIHQMDFPNREAAMVTLTLFVRRLVIAAEGDL